VLEAGLAAAGGAKSTGAMTPLTVPLVDRLKYLRSICGEIIGSDPKGVVSGSAGLLVGAKIRGVEGGAEAGGAVLASVAAAADGVDGVGGGVAGGGSGGGRGIRTRLVTDWAAGRKRNGAGPTTGK
jgi:hypothetical protein